MTIPTRRSKITKKEDSAVHCPFFMLTGSAEGSKIFLAREDIFDNGDGRAAFGCKFVGGKKAEAELLLHRGRGGVEVKIAAVDVIHMGVAE